MRILLIEDDTYTSAYIINNLIGQGHAVDHAVDGIQGYDLAAAHACDLYKPASQT